MSGATERREELKAVFRDCSTCTRCPQLAETRTRVVFGSGNADADLMFVGEAPGRNEDEQGVPFVGQAGKLLEQLLGEIGLERGDVFIANALKCLRYDAMVQLGDGTWERIGRLVRARYDGTVMSVAGDGAVVPRRVTGWHATPLAGREVLRLTFASAKANGIGQASVQLTDDHPVLTQRGYVPARDLRRGDRVATGQGLSRTGFEVVCGTLLGDSSLDRASARLTFSHPGRQSEYAAFKAELLAELGPSLSRREVGAVVGGPVSHDIVHGRTRAHRALWTMRPEFYRDRKRVPEWLAQGLTARMLAIWFMDGGHTRLREGRRPLSEIAADGFGERDRHILRQGLFSLGLHVRSDGRRLCFDAANTRLLSELIAPLVPPPMRDKLDPEVAAHVPYEASRWEPGLPVTMYEEVEIEAVPPERLHGETTFFCIDVDETHNFVTAGGVVHNCRPPGNRDPLPAEINNCQSWLYRQLELIQPKVVCTLGNHATKLLRADPAGITRIHGQAEVRPIGPRTVRLMPLYHPAAALYTRSLLDTLREDFARIPGLLELAAPEQPRPPEPQPPVPDPAVLGEQPAEPDDSQLGLF